MLDDLGSNISGGCDDRNALDKILSNVADYVEIKYTHKMGGNGNSKIALTFPVILSVSWERK